VKDPQVEAAGGFTTYLIVGNDKIGSYEIRRRFNDFFLLREALAKYWPGCYIPPIPSKKATVPSLLYARETRRTGL
jgi:sorting nexin-1/2